MHLEILGPQPLLLRLPAVSNTSEMQRRWLQFKLRSLIIGVTLLCVAFGIFLPRLREQQESAGFARQRDNFLRDHPTYAYVFIPGEEKWLLTRDRTRIRVEGRYSRIALPLDATINEREQAASLFPEANIVAKNPKYKPPPRPVWPNPPVEFRGKWYEPVPLELIEFIPFPDGTPNSG